MREKEYSFKAMADFFRGEVDSLEDFINKNRKRHRNERRPDSWFIQQERCLKMTKAALKDYEAAANRIKNA